MPSLRSTNSLIKGLPRLLETGVHSDLTIICGGKSFRVHKLVLCTQSEVCRQLLEGKFKESGAAQINLPNDEPTVLNVLFQYLYAYELDNNQRPPTSGLWTFLVHVYGIVDKYDVPSLRQLVADRLEDLCDPEEHVDEFVAVLRVIDSCTAGSTLWDIMLPKVKAKLSLLSKDESFQELVMELPSLTIPLLGMLGHDTDHSSDGEPLLKKRKKR